MTKSLAIQLIGASLDLENLEDQWDLYLFNLKQKILQTPLATPLLTILQKRIEQACAAQQLLEINRLPSEPDLFEIKSVDVPEQFDEIQDKIAHYKWQISTATDAFLLEGALSNLLRVIAYYEGWFMKQFIYEEENIFPTNIPARQVAKVMELREELKRFHQNIALDQFPFENLNTFEESYPELWQEMARISKYYTEEELA